MRVRARSSLAIGAAALLAGLSGACCRGRADADPLQLAGHPARADQWADLDGLGRRRPRWPRSTTFLRAARPFLQPPARRRDSRPIYGALREVCRARPRDLRPPTTEAARAFFEENFRPVRIAARRGRKASSPAITSRSSRARAFPIRNSTSPLYRRPRDLVAAGHKPGAEGFPEQGRAGRPAQREERDRALSRSRRHRGRRARRPEARNLLAQGSVRGARRSQIQGSARVDPRGRHAAARQLRRP